MPYVKCPSCECVSYSAAAHATLECCPVCGNGLPLRRRVVPLAAYRRSVLDVSAETVGGSAPSRRGW